jgi:hypothetical protein
MDEEPLDVRKYVNLWAEAPDLSLGFMIRNKKPDLHMVHRI